MKQHFCCCCRNSITEQVFDKHKEKSYYSIDPYSFTQKIYNKKKICPFEKRQAHHSQVVVVTTKISFLCSILKNRLVKLQFSLTGRKKFLNYTLCEFTLSNSFVPSYSRKRVKNEQKPLLQIHNLNDFPYIF